MRLREEKSVFEWIEDYYQKWKTPLDKELLLTEKEHWEKPPKASIRLHDYGYEIEINMPGFEKDEIFIDIVAGRVRIKARKDSVNS